jgi:outer membrane protein TolC
MSVRGKWAGKNRDAAMRVLALCLFALAGSAHLASAQQFPARETAQEERQSLESILVGPEFIETAQAPAVQMPRLGESDPALPINLATAIRLSQARPLVIALAQASIEQAAARLQGANALWLPDIHYGVDYSHHDGATQATEGRVEFASFGSLYTGGGATLDFAMTDAIFRPLAARQELLARQSDKQAACNDALLAITLGYFDVQEMRGRLAGVLDSAAKAKTLLKQVESLASAGVVPEMEIDRARALLADLNQQAIAARTKWYVASARLTRALRLNPGAVVVPVEPPQLQVTLISSRHSVDDLIPCGLMNRPELASQRAVVQATLDILRQERYRPLIPSLVLTGRGPDGSIIGGPYGGGTGGDLNTWGGQAQFDAGLIWTLQNMGAGNRALLRGREADREKALIELLNLQDRVAEDVVQARFQVEGSRGEIPEAETNVKEANTTFSGTLKGLGQIRGAGRQLQTVSRPQEAVAALQQLNRAYDQYFVAINNYNRAQFQLYHALGYPSRILSWDARMGDVQAVDTRRLPMLDQPPHTSLRPSTPARR